MAENMVPQSRAEEILIATINGTEYTVAPQSRLEYLLLELKEVIEEGSGGGGIRPIGVTTTPLYDGATTNPIQINGESYTAETGDMVTYQSTEFLFNVNEVWQELGDVSEVLEIIDDIFADIAPAFDATSTYVVGDYVIYNDLLYRCTTAHTGAWAAADFTATNLSDEIKNNKGTVYTAGKYINIDANNEIKVNPVVPNEAFTYTIKQIDDYSFEIIKTVDNVDVFDEVYSCYDPVAQQQRDVNETFDDAINIHIYPAGERSYTLLIASDAHEAGFKQTTPWYQRNTFVETFSTVDHTGEKLIIKSELDTAINAIKDGQSIDSFADVETALAGKQDTLTAGNNIKINNNAISVNRWFVPAGKVVYTVITSDENYGQNIHIQRHTTGGDFIDDRVYTVGTWQTATIDSLIYIEERYTKFYIELLKNSDEQSAGYNYIVDPNTKSTSNSFTFLMDQEENDNDLIIRSELNAKADLTDLAPAFSTSTAYTVGQYVSYDGNIYKCTSAHSAGAWVAGDFTLVAVGSELESKQDATDNNLQTTDKTVVGAVNELKSGLTNVHDNFTDVIGWDKRKNLYNGSVSADGAFATAYELPSGLTTITISAKKTSDCPQINTLIYDNEGNIIVNYTKLIDASNTSGHVTVTLNKQGYIAIYPVSGGASNINKVFDIQVEKGSTATSYEPYHPVIGPAVEELQSGLTNLNNRTYYTTTWVDFSYYNAGQLSGTYTVPTLPTGWSYRIVSVSNIFPNSELGVKLSGKYLHNTTNREIRAVGTSFESTDTISILVLFEIYKL